MRPARVPLLLGGRKDAPLLCARGNVVGVGERALAALLLS